MSVLDIGGTAARLRHRITLQEVVETPDGAGGCSRAWQDVATFWAEVVPLGGHERLSALQLTGPVTHRITSRYRGDIAADKRFLLDGRVFNIRSVINMQEKDYLMEALAEENTAS